MNLTNKGTPPGPPKDLFIHAYERLIRRTTSVQYNEEVQTVFEKIVFFEFRHWRDVNKDVEAEWIKETEARRARNENT